MNADDYLKHNRDGWNRRTDSHLGSEFYDVASFKAGRCSLNDIELELLGDVAGKSLLHLQCHFGQDTLSLARRGAVVTGVDLSDRAIDAATQLAEELDLKARFVCGDVYQTRELVTDTFDLVFTSYGTIGWLPDLDRWARVIKDSLKPGGRFVMADFHPVVWMFDDAFEGIAHRYFKSDPIVEEDIASYADENASIKKTVTWNHALSETISALLRAGLKLEHLSEYDYSPYSCFDGCKEVAPGRFRIPKFGDRLPMVYALVATVD